MTTLTPSPGPTGTTRQTEPPPHRRLPLLLLGLFLAVIVAGVLYLLLHNDSSAEPANRRVADSGALPASPTPSTASGGNSDSVTGSGTAPTSSRASTSPVIGWVGGAGLAPAHATGGLAKEGSVGTVLFPSNSANLDTDAKQVIVAVANELKKQKPSSVRVTGYTDNVGTPGYNLTLSANRAKAVAAVLNQELPPGWVVSTGKGWANPVAANTTDTNRQLNRRTTITTT